ncbi:prepilin-type N-terminal cleavage/methylation domain-containing protein [Elusimicrobiota bacterium]
MESSKYNKNQGKISLRGFTLTEVIVASVILLVLMLYGLSFFSSGGGTGMRQARVVNYALQIGENRIEEIKAGSYDDILASSFTQHMKYGTTFYRNYTSKEINNLEEKYKILYITMTWIDNGETKQIFLNTIIAEED